MSKFIGFVVSGFIHGGGREVEGNPKDTFDEAWADAQQLFDAEPFGDKTLGVRPYFPKPGET